jgi:hypothetical protein
MSTKKSLFKRLCGTVYNSYKTVMTRASYRGNKSKGRATSSKFVNRSSEGFNETDRRSKEIRGVADCPLKLPELDKTEFLEGGEAGMSSWGLGVVDGFFTCKGNREREWYDAAAKEVERLKQMRV